MVGFEPGSEGAAALFDARAQSLKVVVERHDGASQQVGGIVLLALLARPEQLLEKRRVWLRAAIVLGADVIQVGAIGQRGLGDDIDVAAIKMLVLGRLAIVRDEALAED